LKSKDSFRDSGRNLERGVSRGRGVEDPSWGRDCEADEYLRRLTKRRGKRGSSDYCEIGGSDKIRKNSRAPRKSERAAKRKTLQVIEGQARQGKRADGGGERARKRLAKKERQRKGGRRFLAR